MRASACAASGRALVVVTGAVLLLSGRAARAECYPLAVEGLTFASLIAAGEVESVRPEKKAGRAVTIRVSEYVRGPGPEVVTFHEAPSAAHCAAVEVVAGRRYLVFLRERLKGGLAPLSVVKPDYGLGPAIVALEGDALPAPLWPGGPSSVPELRTVVEAAEPRVLYEPAEPTEGEPVKALLPAPLGCSMKARLKRRGRVLLADSTAKAGCVPLAAPRPWVPLALGRLTHGRYVLFYGGEWLAYLVVKPRAP